MYHNLWISPKFFKTNLGYWHLDFHDFKTSIGTTLAIHGLRLCTSNAGARGMIPGQRTKMPHAMRYGKKKNKQLLQTYANNIENQQIET